MAAFNGNPCPLVLAASAKVMGWLLRCSSVYYAAGAVSGITTGLWRAATQVLVPGAVQLASAKLGGVRASLSQ